MGRYWKKFPPYHVLFAGHVGYKPAADASTPEDDEAEFEELLKLFPVRGTVPTGDPDQTPPPTPSGQDPE